MGTNVLEINGLYKSFGTHKVIDGLDFAVPEGSIYGFVGVNGSGKTTTMKMALGLLETDGGVINICGERVCYGKTAEGVGYLPDVPEFYPYMRPMEYLMLCGEISGMPKSRVTERGGELLNLVGLGDRRKIGGFSRGMRQRLGIAQALLGEPKLLICDEPTSALDPMGRKEILDILAAVKGRTTVIFSTHILSDVERICDSVAFLHGGKIALSGPLTELRKRHMDSYKLEFAERADAAKFASLDLGRASPAYVDESIASDGAELDGNVVTIKNADGARIIAALAEARLTPIKFELLEPSLEDMFLGVLK
ncbi:MAG: ABC transporter ATP-binding protein [Oscillospiraceae bacterium]|nr:ABC transporter ATP-binding protein [Oscillospiraceae bacterium]